ncbi:MAG TPA: hypothetical protein VF669_03760 [Tepidisphaeraceae bacterium]|jgi:uncharacterized delta-60 repeat protein
MTQPFVQLLERRRLLASPELDLTFGEGGVGRVTNIWGAVLAMNALPDGKIVLWGSGNSEGGKIAGFQDDPVVARFNANGILDTSFDGDGILPLPQNDGYAPMTTALAPDGKFVAAKDGLNGNMLQSRFFRFNADGTPDVSFGTGGIANINVQNVSVGTVAVQPGGKIVFQFYRRDISEALLGRLNADGTVDNTFRGGLTDSQPTAVVATGEMKIGADGAIYVLGTSEALNGKRRLGVARFNADGSPDANFAGDGFAEILPADDDYGLYSVRMAVDPQGRLLVAAEHRNLIITRFTTTGLRDTTFGGGDAIAEITSQGGGTLTNLVASSDGKITGSFKRANPDRVVLFRLNDTGALDTTFGAGGLVDPKFQLFEPHVLALDPAGNVLSAGVTSDGYGYDDLGVSRFVSDSPDVALSAQGTLYVTGTDDADRIVASPSGANILIIRNNATTYFPAAKVKLLTVLPSSGGDVITVSFRMRSNISGGTGNDTITLLGGDATINAGTGNDKILCDDGNHTIDLGAGDDRIETGVGRDRIIGGLGTKRIITGPGSDTIETGNGNDYIRTSSGADKIYCGDGNDTVYAGDGNDRVQDYTDPSTNELTPTVQNAKGRKHYYGEGGNDTISGSSEADTIVGGSGRDSIYGATGSDYLSGGGGSDWMSGARWDENAVANTAVTDRDTLLGGEGNDTISGSNGSDTISGEAGSDRIKAIGGNDQISGGDGNDKIEAGFGSDTVYGNGGDDRIDAGEEADLVYGQAGRDTLYGGAANDTLYGGDDNDWFDGQAGKDKLFGEDGTDTSVADKADLLDGVEKR